MPAIVGWIVSGIVSAVLWLFKNRIGQFVMSVLGFMGIGLATYNFGVQPFLDQLQSMAQSGMGGGQYAAVALQWAGLLNLDKAITIIISAIAAKHALIAGRVFLKKLGTA